MTPAVGQAVAGGFSCMRDLMEGWEKLERGGNSAEAALMLQDLLVRFALRPLKKRRGLNLIFYCYRSATGRMVLLRTGSSTKPSRVGSTPS